MWTCSQCFLFEKGSIVIYMQFSFVTSDWVSIFLEFESCKAATFTHLFWSGLWIWPVCVRRLESEVFNLQAWVSQLKQWWELAGILSRYLFLQVCMDLTINLVNFKIYEGFYGTYTVCMYMKSFATLKDDTYLYSS